MKKIICLMMCFVLIFGFSPMQANAKKKIKVKCTVLYKEEKGTLKIKNTNKYDVVVYDVAIKYYKNGEIIEKISFPDKYKIKKGKTKKDYFEDYDNHTKDTCKITYKCKKAKKK